MLRDILRDDPQSVAVIQVIVANSPDILLLQGIDYDFESHAIRLLRDKISEAGLHYSHLFAARPNSGRQTPYDLNGDGKLGGPADAQGYGRYNGQGGMAVLSRYPIDTDYITDFSSFLWKDLPHSTLNSSREKLFPSTTAMNAQRLSSVAHWIVPIQISPEKSLSLLAYHAGPPVFDGPEDRNGIRNADETLFWVRYLDNELGTSYARPPKNRFVILGDANLDPDDGEGRKVAIRGLLNHPLIFDPAPRHTTQPIDDQIGDPQLDTVEWPAPKPGNLRVDYVLPSIDLEILGAGTFWPEASMPDADLLSYKGINASRHRLVWVDLKM
jgi:hypothetical protein